MGRSRGLVPDLRLLEYFITVAEELSFVRAAHRLYVSPPTLSAGIKTLESRLGVELFARSPRSVELTDAGRRLLPNAKMVVSESEALTEKANLLAGRVTLRAGTISGLGGSLMNTAARRLESDGQPIELAQHVSDWTEPTAGLANQETDVAILVGPTQLDDRLQRTTLWRDPIYAVVPSRHPAAKSETLTVEDLDEIGFVWCREGDGVAHSFWRLDHLRGGSPERSFLCDSPQELFLAIRSDRGICCIPRGFVDLFGFSELTLVPVPEAGQVGVDISHRRNRGSGLVNRFVEAVIEVSGGRQPLVAVSS
jgi:DNA-binding transcriptional LysR family regulator